MLTIFFFLVFIHILYGRWEFVSFLLRQNNFFFRFFLFFPHCTVPLILYSRKKYARTDRRDRHQGEETPNTVVVYLIMNWTWIFVVDNFSSFFLYIYFVVVAHFCASGCRLKNKCKFEYNDMKYDKCDSSFGTTETAGPAMIPRWRLPCSLSLFYFFFVFFISKLCTSYDRIWYFHISIFSLQKEMNMIFLRVKIHLGCHWATK